MRSTLCAVGVLVLAGCGSMTVHVSTLDPTYVEAEADRQLARETLPEALAQTDVGVKTEIGSLRRLHFGAYLQDADELQEAADNADASPSSVSLANVVEQTILTIQQVLLNRKAEQIQNGNAAQIQSEFAEAMGPIYTQVQRRVISLNQDIRKLEADRKAATDDENRERAGELRLALTSKLRQRAYALQEIYRAVLADVETRLSRAQVARLRARGRNEVKAADENVEALVGLKAKVEAKLERVGVGSNPYLHAIVSAPSEAWKPSNEVYSVGHWGNIDVAVRLIPAYDESYLPAGDYTLKGLSFDPSDVARMAAKATTQAVLLSAQIAGVPVNLDGTPTGDGAALAISSGRLAEAERQVSQTRAKLQGHQDALSALGRTIVENESQLADADPNVRASAIEAVLATYEAQKGRVRLEDE